MKPIFSGFIASTILFLVHVTCSIAGGPDLPIQMRVEHGLSNNAVTIKTVSSAGMTTEASGILSPERYIVIDVMPATGTQFSRGYGINNLGQVVGRTYNYNEETEVVEDLQALFWDLNHGSTVLAGLGGDSGGWGINDTGMASGFSTNADGYLRAVRWDLSDGSIVDLGALTNPNTQVSGDASYAYGGINNNGVVVGDADIPNDAGSFIPFHAFIYNDVNGIQDLGTLSTDTTSMGGYSIAYDITEDNRVVGLANIDGWGYRAFFWTEAGGMTALATDGVIEDGEWYASTINESGLIGGFVIDGDAWVPHYWPSKDDSPVAITMPADYPYGEPYAVNESGQMVGLMFNDADEEHAFIFDSTNGLVDLNDRIDPDSGWVLINAVDINDLGQITGTGVIDDGKRAYLLTPDADTDQDGDIDGSDLAQLTAEMDQSACSGTCSADFNQDDAVNAMDTALLGILLGKSS